jgi:hypothetical protein
MPAPGRNVTRRSTSPPRRGRSIIGASVPLRRRWSSSSQRTIWQRWGVQASRADPMKEADHAELWTNLASPELEWLKGKNTDDELTALVTPAKEAR